MAWPIGHAVNPNGAMVTGFFPCMRTRRKSRRRRRKDGPAPSFAMVWRIIISSANTSRDATDIWANFEKGAACTAAGRRPITANRHARSVCETHLRQFEESGVDQTVFIQQGGPATSTSTFARRFELFAEEVMPEFRQAAKNRAGKKKKAEKQEELAPHIEKGDGRASRRLKPMRDEEIPVFVALGRKVAEEGTGTERQKQNAQAMGRCRQGKR